MSKLTLVAVIGATILVAGCARKAPAPEPVLVQPIMVEPVGIKSK